MTIIHSCSLNTREGGRKAKSRSAGDKHGTRVAEVERMGYFDGRENEQNSSSRLVAK